jgi:hypothetical protein
METVLEKDTCSQNYITQKSDSCAETSLRMPLKCCPDWSDAIATAMATVALSLALLSQALKNKNTKQ